jgi:hypothetical protein
MTTDDRPYIPRFSFEVSEELQTRASKLLSTYGLRKAVMTPILEDLLDMIEEHGQIVVGVILDSGTKPREVIKSMAKAERKATNG